METTEINQVIDFRECQPLANVMQKSCMKNNMQVTVTTNQNGSYTLTCQDNRERGDYLYFTPEELAIGVALHVADGIIKDMAKGDIADIITDHLVATKIFKAELRSVKARLHEVQKKNAALNRIISRNNEENSK